MVVSASDQVQVFIAVQNRNKFAVWNVAHLNKIDFVYLVTLHVFAIGTAFTRKKVQLKEPSFPIFLEHLSKAREQ